ncbi:hypothetical protein [Cyanobium sp. CH-040]|uniref:hypothetical protein n=1 Tax=Cyanobium sp. CH-040 TaxID=2823708 RepID=UPI0020CC1234|nr:hypothetical protein [Cyanobium sp. CH-040]MCP9926467.1 hypothetical protein [Cyanobium sp. CH-040]
MDRRLPPLLVPLALALTACSGTPFGEQLSGSFPEGQDAAAPAPAPESPAVGSGPGTAAAPAPASPPGQSPAAPPSQPQAAAPVPAAGSPPAPVAMAPAPYRLTLRLTGADPSAPAEAVTRALRAAGLAFEVEVIERIPDAAAPAAPASTPAPDPVSPPATR